LVNGANFSNCFVGNLSVVGNNNTVSNCRCRSLPLALGAGFNNFSNVRIQETLTMGTTTARNNFSDIQITGDLGITGLANTFSNVQFSGAINLDGAARNTLNNIIGDGLITISGAGGQHVLHGIRGLAAGGPSLTLASTGNDNDISDFRLSTIIFTSDTNNKFSNGVVNSDITVAAPSDGNMFSNIDFQGSVTSTSGSNQFASCRFAGSDWTATGTSNIVTTSRFTVPMVLSGVANAATFPLFVGNRGAAPLGNPPATGSDPLSFSNSVL